MHGLQVLKRTRQVSAQQVKDFFGLPVANISDCMARMTSAGPRLRPMHKQGYLAGPALTVKCRPGDNLMIHKALTMAQPGDVIVVDAGGELTNALFGEQMMATSIRIGLAGIVLNGAVRDSAEIASGDFPLYAAGITHRGPYKDGPGEINVVISVDGMVIAPGDLIVGDADGLLCVPYEKMDEVLLATRKKMQAEELAMKAISTGTLDTAWIDKTLQRIGCNTEPKIP